MEKRPIIVAASGYMDCLHKGHIEYLEKAKALGDKLIVIVNNDNQAKLKKGFSFMSQDERLKIISSLKCVDEVMLSIDTDRTVCASLKALCPDIFAKGGDQNQGTIPEKVICDELGISIVDGLGDKIQSSRWLLRECKKNLEKLDDKYLNEGM
jgi:cytidyltransferase-like protein